MPYNDDDNYDECDLFDIYGVETQEELDEALEDEKVLRDDRDDYFNSIM